MDTLHKRMKENLTPAHLLAYLIDPKYLGDKLSADEYNIAMKYAN